MKNYKNSDPYLDQSVQFTRLYNDYSKHNKLIVAFDFDNTVYDFHNVGFEFPKLETIMRKCQELDFEIVIFTANTDYKLIHRRMDEIGIEKYLINSSSVKLGDSIKPYFNILLDDRAGLNSAYNTLNSVIDTIQVNLGESGMVTQNQGPAFPTSTIVTEDVVKSLELKGINVEILDSPDDTYSVNVAREKLLKFCEENDNHIKIYDAQRTQIGDRLITILRYKM